MTKREAAIVAAYTGFLVGEFSDMHGYVEEIMGRPVWTHEMGNFDFYNQIRERAKKDYVNLKVE